MNEFPSIILTAIDAGDPQSQIRPVRAAPNSRPEPLDLDRVNELWCHALGDRLEADDFAIE